MAGLRDSINNKESLVVGETYCVTYRDFNDMPCIFATYTGEVVHFGGVRRYMFKRIDLPGPNQPNFNPDEPEDIGGRWEDLIIYKAAARGGRRKKTRKSRKTRKARKTSRKMRR